MGRQRSYRSENSYVESPHAHQYESDGQDYEYGSSYGHASVHGYIQHFETSLCPAQRKPPWRVHQSGYKELQKSRQKPISTKGP